MRLRHGDARSATKSWRKPLGTGSITRVWLRQIPRPIFLQPWECTHTLSINNFKPCQVPATDNEQKRFFCFFFEASKTITKKLAESPKFCVSAPQTMVPPRRASLIDAHWHRRPKITQFMLHACTPCCVGSLSSTWPGRPTGPTGTWHWVLRNFRPPNLVF